ncbi:MAG: flagellar hook-associated protein FlgL [Dermatophilaceae bacterium]
MSLRVTPATLNRSVMDGLQGNLSRLQHTQQQLASGRRINRMSDSPVDGAAAMRLRAEQGANEQLGRNVEDGLNTLGAADTTFTSMSALVLKIRQLVVSGLNSTNGPAEREAMATEIDQLKDGLIGLANTQYLGRPIFAGTQDVTAAYDATTGQYLGNNSAVQRSVSTDSKAKLDVTVTGPATFSTLFNDGVVTVGVGTVNTGILNDISAALRDPTRTPDLNTQLGKLDIASETMQNARSVVGTRFNRLLSIQGAGESRLDAVTANLAVAENIDLPKTIIDMQIQSTSYQAALGAAAKIIQPSLLDFLR